MLRCNEGWTIFSDWVRSTRPGLTDQEKLSSELMLRSLIDAQQAAKFKEWEMPINPIFGFQTRLRGPGWTAFVRFREGLRRLH